MVHLSRSASSPSLGKASRRDVPLTPLKQALVVSKARSWRDLLLQRRSTCQTKTVHWLRRTASPSPGKVSRRAVPFGIFDRGCGRL